MSRPIRLVPPVYLLAALLIQIALDRWLPLWRVDSTSGRYVGIGVIGLAFAIVLWATFLFHRSKTTIKPFEASSALVTAGPYRFTRNPMYLSLSLILTGLALILGSSTPFVVVPAFMAAIQWRFIRREESALAQAFGNRYRDYQRRVRRWL